MTRFLGSICYACRRNASRRNRGKSSALSVLTPRQFNSDVLLSTQSSALVVMQNLTPKRDPQKEA